MKTYRLTFTISNGMTGCINNNTFFGLFCEGLKRVMGTEFLEEMLDDLYNERSTLVFSNPLECETTNFAKYVTEEIPHGRIDRNNEGKNELFVVKDNYINQFDVLCITDLDYVEEIFNTFVDLHIGSRKSVGKGRILSINIKESELSNLDRVAKLVSNIVPTAELSLDGDFDYVTRKGYTIKGIAQPTVILLKGGSQFILNNTSDVKKHIVGKILKFDDGSYLNGMGILV